MEDRFTGVDGVRLRYIRSKQTDRPNALIILGGRTEFAEKYAEFIFDLKDLDFSIYSYDHRGQGLSERLIDDRKKGHVLSFSDYSSDLSIFIEKIVHPARYEKIFILGHSMGCTVAAEYLQSVDVHFDGVVFLSPMLGIKTSPLPNIIARNAVWIAASTGFGQKYIWGGKYYDPSDDFRNNKVTSSERRFLTGRALVRANPDLALGGATFNWVSQSFKAMARVMKNAESIKVPLLMIQSGNDMVVDSRAQDLFCLRCPDCTRVKIDGALHELIMERDEFRDQAVSLIKRFLLHCRI